MPNGSGLGTVASRCRARPCRSGSSAGRPCARPGPGRARRGLAVGEQHDRRRRALAVLLVVAGARRWRPPARRRWRWRRRRPGRRRCGARRRGRRSAPGRRRACRRTRRRRRAPRSGSWSRNVRAARCAAARRSGSTSVADIEREWSVTSMIDGPLDGHGDGLLRLGQRQHERGQRREGQRRRQVPAPGGHGRPRRLERGHGGEAHRVAAAAPAAGAGRPAAASGTSSQAQQPERVRRSSSQPPPELQQPVAIGGQRDVVDVQAAQLARDLVAALALELGEALAHARARGVDLEALAGLGVDERQAADGGQLAPRAGRRPRRPAPSGAPRARRAAASSRAGRGSRR